MIHGAALRWSGGGEVPTTPNRTERACQDDFRALRNVMTSELERQTCVTVAIWLGLDLFQRHLVDGTPNDLLRRFFRHYDTKLQSTRCSFGRSAPDPMSSRILSGGQASSAASSARLVPCCVASPKALASSTGLSPG